MTRIDRIIEEVIEREGGYVDDPDDRGGETMYGITVAVARDYGYDGPMRELPIGVAREIYRVRYIHRPGFALVLAIDSDIGVELVDTGVNMGPAKAGEFLQRWLNGFNSAGKYERLFVDGAVGRRTAEALRAFLAWRGKDGKTALLRALNGLQAARYLEITEARPEQRKFLFGWVLNRVVMEG